MSEMIAVEIICVNKDNGHHYNRHEAITNYGWWDTDDKKVVKTPRAKMVAWIEKDKENHLAYVVDKKTGKKAYCFVNKSIHGTKFLQTFADGDWRDNLLYLGECK